MNVEIGTVAAQFLSENICFKDSVLVLCSEAVLFLYRACQCYVLFFFTWLFFLLEGTQVQGLVFYCFAISLRTPHCKKG